MRHFLLLFLLLVVVDYAHAKKLHIAFTPWEPYTIANKKTVSGINVDVVSEVFTQMGYATQPEVLPWQRALYMLKTKQVDAVISSVYVAERARYAYYSTTPISYSSSCIFYRKDAPVHFTGLKSLTGLRVGMVAGYYYGEEIANAKNFIRDNVYCQENNFKKLLAGRVDAVVANRVVGTYIMHKLGIAKKLTSSPQNLTTSRPVFVIFAHKKGYKQLAQKFSTLLQKFKKSQKYVHILARYGISKNMLSYKIPHVAIKNMPPVNALYPPNMLPEYRYWQEEHQHYLP